MKDGDKQDFWAKVSVGFADECWEWQGYVTPDGYGKFKKVGRAHRIAYTLAVGPIPEGMMVLHSCDNRSCVNPDHLRVGTHQDNMRDVVERQRQPRSRWTKCVNGHPFSKENTYIKPNGMRFCKRCDAERKRRYRASRREKGGKTPA